MKRDKGFACTYFQSAAMEKTQSADIQVCLYRLWAAHHDDYAPVSLKIGKVLPGGNKAVVMLVQELRDRSVKSAQKDMNKLYFG